MFLQFRPVFTGCQPVTRHIMPRIPRTPKTADRLAGRLGQAFRVQRQEGVELVQVDVFVLLIDVPEQRPPCPLCADKGIFTAHGVEIATPKHVIVLILSDERQDLYGQLISHMQRTGSQSVDAQPTFDIPENPASGTNRCVGVESTAITSSQLAKPLFS